MPELGDNDSGNGSRSGVLRYSEHMRKKTPQGARESALASGWTVEGDAPDPAATDAQAAELGTPAEQDPAGTESTAEPGDGLSNTAIVLLGAFGGLYLLYAWGWFIVAQAYSSVNALTAAGSGLVGGILQQVVFWAAPAAPIAWLVAAILLTRGRGSAKLALALIVGALVLIPLPMLVSGVVA